MAPEMSSPRELNGSEESSSSLHALRGLLIVSFGAHGLILDF
jgi:hypothetical protein